MNNLIALNVSVFSVRDALGGEVCIALDVNPSIRAVFGASESKLVGLSLHDGENLAEAPIPGDGTSLVCLHSLPEFDGIFVATAGGKLLLLTVQSGAWEEVGEIEGGLVCAEWSSDDEVLMCVTVEGTIVLLNTSWDVLAEKELGPKALGGAAIAWNGDGMKASLQTRDREGGTGRVIVLDRDLKVQCPRIACLYPVSQLDAYACSGGAGR